ncbi:AcrB/AcrD/AcrF family protein [Sphingomonas quercus]|uniref:AcrB/AcrD/AcrF family protein n=1 Tax=Sphingomonas quercus TaxID=2842451 RepID=A0ABS6BG19_9SPHN|nr:AcrB/AcrD/AcrF family protein [Sphingomonas quercus]MBU3077237.1 AcrB/AcrD/AcrF family protein [Sphingomonas quercus]
MDQVFGGKGWLKWLFAAWVLAAAWMLWSKWGAIGWFALGDTDDNLRFAEVRDWLRGQGWYDLRQYHLDPPGGASIHWSRLVDLPIAGIILIVRPFWGTIIADKAAVAVAPLLPLALAMLGMALTARRLVSPGAWVAAVAMMLCGESALLMWMPLRIDHHGWQLAFLALTLAGVADPRRLRGGVTTGLATAASLTIGLEMLPYFGIAAAALVLRWVADPGDARRLAGYGISLAAGAGLGFAGFASWDNAAAVCDALSPVWLSDALVGGALVVGLALARVGDWRARLALALAAGAVLAGFHATQWPQCLGRPENVSPELNRIWLSHVREARPIYLHPWRTGVQIAALPLVGLIGALWATWRSRGTARFPAWACALFFAAASSALLLWQMRAAPAAQLLAAPGAMAITWYSLIYFRSREGRRLSAVLLVPAVFLLASGVAARLLVQSLPPAAPTRKADLRPGVPDRSRFCSTLPSLRPIARLPAATFLTLVDFGPRLVATTHHSAIAGPYHRNGAAILDVQHAFRGSEAVAHDVVRRHGVQWVLICPGMGESTIYATEAKQGFYMMLANGRAPGWLSPVALPTRNPLRLWKVIG